MKPPPIPRRGIRWAAVFDTHGDQLDDDAARVFFDFIEKHWKPERRIHGGDAFDFRWLRGKATIEEKAQDINDDIEAGLDFLKRLKPTVFLWGNHDARLMKAIQHPEGSVRKLGSDTIDDLARALNGATALPYDARRGVFRMGDLSVVHGYRHGLQAVRDTARDYGNVIMGHLHRSERQVVDRVEETWGLCPGCLCRLDPDYIATSPARFKWRHGFVYGVTLPGGRNVVFEARKTGDEWLLPSEMIALK